MATSRESGIGSRDAYWRMSPGVASLRLTPVELRVTFEPGEPPCGHVELVGSLRAHERAGWRCGASIPFIGWLGLLRVLSDLLALPDDP